MFFDRLIAVLNSSTINYTHNANNELTAAGAIGYSYDQNGNTIQETNPPQADSITKYTYNSSNRLERVELPDGRIAEYKYDPFGRRISKTINNSASADGLTTYYLYADEGLIGEYDSAGNNIKSYGWIPDSIWGTNPVFMLENNNSASADLRYYFYHNDHLGTPQKMTDEAGNVVWSAAYTAFGEAAIDAGSTITNNLRFAGQYFDEETGKHYNWNRYYDPKTGRYTQVDPIGNGLNLYSYVKNNVINEVDPKGLQKGRPVPRPQSSKGKNIYNKQNKERFDTVEKALSHKEDFDTNYRLDSTWTCTKWTYNEACDPNSKENQGPWYTKPGDSCTCIEKEKPLLKFLNPEKCTKTTCNPKCKIEDDDPSKLVIRSADAPRFCIEYSQGATKTNLPYGD